MSLSKLEHKHAEVRQARAYINKNYVEDGYDGHVGYLQLAFYPAIQSAILDGTQPEHLTPHSLTRPEMPPDWDQQYRRTGISPI